MRFMPTLPFMRRLLLYYQYNTGSYNFSKAANARNSENMLYIQDEDLAKAYHSQWNERFQ